MTLLFLELPKQKRSERTTTTIQEWLRIFFSLIPIVSYFLQVKIKGEKEKREKKRIVSITISGESIEKREKKRKNHRLDYVTIEEKGKHNYISNLFLFYFSFPSSTPANFFGVDNLTLLTRDFFSVSWNKLKRDVNLLKQNDIETLFRHPHPQSLTDEDSL